MDIFFHSERGPVFIVSAGRSGSMMLARTLEIHPDICALHEPLPHMNMEAFAKWTHRTSTEQILRRIRMKRETLIRNTLVGGMIYVESSHYASHFIPELREVFNAKFVHLYRDGRHFVRSGLARDWWYTKQSAFSRLASYIRRRYLIDIGNSFTDHRLIPPTHLATRFEKVAWLWVEINRVIMDSFLNIPSEAQYAFRLEDLCEKTIIGLCDFIGVSTNLELTKAMLAKARERPNRSKGSTVPDHTQWPTWEIRRFKELAGSMMQKLGYEA